MRHLPTGVGGSSPIQIGAILGGPSASAIMTCPSGPTTGTWIVAASPWAWTVLSSWTHEGGGGSSAEPDRW